jgi:exportin-5
MEPQKNGDGHTEGSEISQSQFLPQVLQALQAVHDPQSSNGQRQEATVYLERAKSDGQAPLLGFNLAVDKDQSPVVRHYGLSILEYSLRYRWDDFGEEQIAALRDWIVQLAHGLTERDVSFLRNKVAQLWVDMAKRTWGSEWMDMDSMLLQIWSSNMVHKEFVITVLEALSEDIFNSEDMMAALRGATLNRACVDIFTPASVLTEHFSDREPIEGIRAGQEGWLVRIGDFITQYITSGSHNNQRDAVYIIKALDTLAATMNWAIPQAILMARCLERTCGCLGIPNIQIQTVRIFHNL